MNDAVKINVMKSLVQVAMSFHRCENLQLMEFTHINSPTVHINLYDCTGANISNLHIVAPHDSPNTDGIDVSKTSNVIIQDCIIETGPIHLSLGAF